MMHHTPFESLAKQHLFQRQRKQSTCLNTFNLLTSDILFDKLESLLPEHRERLFPPTETLAMFVTQALSSDRSCQQIVNQAVIQRLVNGLPVCSTYNGGYCRARQRLPLEMIRELTTYLGTQIDHQQPNQWRWQGRRVKLVDGTTLTMPDTAANQSTFPQQRGQKPGLGFPICRMVGITCLSSGVVLNAAIGRFNGKGGDEQTLLRSLYHSLQAGDIVLGDAFYPTYFFLVQMHAQRVDLLMEQQGARQRSTDFRQGVKLGTRDHLIVIHKPKIKPGWMTQTEYLEAPESVTVREFKAGGKIMVTTLLDPKTVCKVALKALYQKRWSIEVDLRHIKDTMGMNILSCKTPEMILKEIWVYLLAYNLMRLLMLQSAMNAGIQPREISFKHCVQLWLAFSQISESSCEIYGVIFNDLIAQQRVGKRPGRIEPRAVKRRPKAYPLLTVPRDEARESVRVYGHPKKLK